MEVTYASIKSLIVSEEVEGQMIKLKFKASNQDTPLETMAYVQVDQKEMMAKISKQMGKSVATSVGINMAASALGSAIGGVGGQVARSAGSVAGSAASSAAFDASKLTETDVTDEKKEAAIVTAFGHLSMYYKHNGTEWEYVQPTA